MQSPRWRCETTRADDNAKAIPYRLGLDADGFYNSTTEEVVSSSQSDIRHTTNDAVNDFSALCAINRVRSVILFSLRSFVSSLDYVRDAEGIPASRSGHCDAVPPSRWLFIRLGLSTYYISNDDASRFCSRLVGQYATPLFLLFLRFHNDEKSSML